MIKFNPQKIKTYGTGFLASITAACQIHAPDHTQDNPNIILILADDMGYGDLASYGGIQYATPNLDELAQNGVRLTNFYASQAISSASRASLLTGCYANRIGINSALFPHDNKGMNPKEVTIAEILQQKGYTNGIFGKWHLGHHKEFLPLQQGFDEYLGIPYSNDMWPRNFDGTLYNGDTTNWKHTCPPLPLIEGDKKIDELNSLEDQSKLTTMLTERAINFIKRNKENPFFLYLPHVMPHVPIAASDKYKGTSEQGMYGDVIQEIDWSVGQIVQVLKDYGIDDNTIIIFTSDNGPSIGYGNHGGSNGGLKSGKHTSWEGGVRVPCIISWPGNIKNGRICNKIAATIDVLPTLATITNASLPKNTIDGVNILPLLQGIEGANPRDHFYYYYKENDLEAVRKDNWKLVFPHKYVDQEYVPFGFDGRKGQWTYQHTGLKLFDLRRDPGERYDVKEHYTNVVKALQELAEKARADMGDNLTDREGRGRRKCGIIPN